MSIIHEVENKTYAELKAECGSLVEPLRSVRVDELAERYLKALIDAKLRDEKLAEQAKTLAALQDGIKAVKANAAANVATLRAEIERLNRVLAAGETDLAAAGTHIASRDAEIDTLGNVVSAGATQIADLEAKVERITTQANRYNSAFSTIHKLVLDTLNGQAAYDAASGE